MQRYVFMVGFPSLSREDFQADNRGDQRRDEEHPPEAGGSLEDQDADEGQCDCKCLHILVVCAAKITGVDATSVIGFTVSFDCFSVHGPKTEISIKLTEKRVSALFLSLAGCDKADPVEVQDWIKELGLEKKSE